MSEDACCVCETPSRETNLGWSEERDDLVCVTCVAFLTEHGHYPDEEGPKQQVSVEYELTPRGEDDA